MEKRVEDRVFQTVKILQGMMTKESMPGETRGPRHLRLGTVVDLQNLFMSGSIFLVENLMSFRKLREFSHLMTVLDGFGFAHMEGLQEALGFSSHQDLGSQSPCLAGP